MGHTPEDDNFDEFMNASAEEWSKPEAPAPSPAPESEPTDRWGSPIASQESVRHGDRWGSEPIGSPTPKEPKPAAKGRRTGWIIAGVVLAILLLCGCLITAVLELVGVINIF